jgi:gamma-polyglutamate synthase
LVVLTACFAAFLIWLTVERAMLDRARRRIPVRIAVTGTRGKTGVTRMLASVLRESGRKALAKTTGSEPVIVFPDGSEREVRRRGPASILEQIGLLKTAARAGADCLIAEVMSIHPENHGVETRKILQPTIVAVTNARLDHTETMGATVEQIASVLALDIVPESKVFIPEHSLLEPFVESAKRRSASIFPVASGVGTRFYWHTAEFPENVDLVCAIARHMNVDDETLERGLRKTRHDVGQLGIWRAEAGGRTLYFVNAFAANDPESTFAVLSKIRERLAGGCAGVLNLRMDRGARTLQWVDALHARGTAFDRIFVTGGHAAVLKRKYPTSQLLRPGAPETMTATIIAGLPSGAVVFGFGNIKGSGLELARYWSRLGTPYGI